MTGRPHNASLIADSRLAFAQSERAPDETTPIRQTHSSGRWARAIFASASASTPAQSSSVWSARARCTSTPRWVTRSTSPRELRLRPDVCLVPDRFAISGTASQLLRPCSKQRIHGVPVDTSDKLPELCPANGLRPFLRQQSFRRAACRLGGRIPGPSR